MIRGVLERLEELRQLFRLGDRRYAYQKVEDVMWKDDQEKVLYYLKSPLNRLKVLKMVLDKTEDAIEGEILCDGICVLLCEVLIEDLGICAYPNVIKKSRMCLSTLIPEIVHVEDLGLEEGVVRGAGMKITSWGPLLAEYYGFEYSKGEECQRIVALNMERWMHVVKGIDVLERSLGIAGPRRSLDSKSTSE